MSNENANFEGGPYRTEVFEAFLNWSVLTTDEKKKVGTPTAKAFASKYKIHQSQLSRWKARGDFSVTKAELNQRQWSERTPDVIEGLYKRCVRYGMASDVELWLAYVERWDKKQVHEIKGSVSLRSDDIRSLVDYLPPEKRKLFYETLAGLIAEVEQYKQKELGK